MLQKINRTGIMTSESDAKKNENKNIFISVKANLHSVISNGNIQNVLHAFCCLWLLFFFSTNKSD